MGWWAAAPWVLAQAPATAPTTTVNIDVQCGDIPSNCDFLFDGVCDDGSVGADYNVCSPFSDATDCDTHCDSHSPVQNTHPCFLHAWATRALASSSEDETELGAAEAIGPPTYPLTCSASASQVHGLWGPADADLSPWLLAGFEKPLRLSTLQIFEHASPASQSGFVTKIDLLSTAEEWTESAFDLDNLGGDHTKCGQSLILHAVNSSLNLKDLAPVKAVRIHFKPRPPYARLFVDAVAMSGMDETCQESTSSLYSAPSPVMPESERTAGINSNSPSPPDIWFSFAVPPLPSPHRTEPPPPPRRYVDGLGDTPMPMIIVLLVWGFVTLSVIFHHRWRQNRRSTQRVAVLPPGLTRPPNIGIANMESDRARLLSENLLTSDTDPRVTKLPQGVNLASILFFKPRRVAHVGILLRDAKYHPIVAAIEGTSAATASAFISRGDALLSINGCPIRGADEATRMISAAEGTFSIIILRATDRAAQEYALETIANIDGTTSSLSNTEARTSSRNVTHAPSSSELEMSAVHVADEPPVEYRCPIAQELMRDPVVTADGHTYERAEIFRWLCNNETSPLTGQVLPSKVLTPAIVLKQLIGAWLDEHPSYRY